MLFQCRIVGRTTVYLNGRVLPLDAQGCVDVTTEADMSALRAAPKEWSATIAARNAGLPASVAVATKGAAAFLEAYEDGGDFRSKVDQFKSAATRTSFLLASGFRFSDEELAAEMAKRQPPPPPQEEVPATPTRVAPRKRKS
jgi:hypothetical protein